MKLAPVAPRTKPVAHKTLKNGPVYVSVSDSDVVIEFNLSIEKIGRVLDEKGNPAVNPGDNLPIYWFGHNLRAVTLSKEEWLVRKQLMEDGQ